MSASLLEDRISLLRKFTAREGHTRVPRSHVEDGVKLGRWVDHQRSQYQRGAMSPERQAAIEAVPGWEWRIPPADPGQKKALAALRAFIDREGHSFVPSSHWEGDVRLGDRADYWRSRHRQKKLGEEAVTALEATPGWAWERPSGLKPRRRPNTLHAEFWANGISALEAFAAREGHTSVPRHHREDGLALGGWVDNRRKAYRNGLLTAEQIAQLEGFPGWVWGPYDGRWVREYELLLDYAAATRSPLPPKGTVVDGVDLAQWAEWQRTKGRLGYLAAERRAQLEAIPGWSWGVRTPRGKLLDRWDGWIALLEAFIDREGHSIVPRQHHESGRGLGDWVFDRRRDYRLGHLPSECIARLEAVPGWDWRGPSTGVEEAKGQGIQEARWQEGMNALRAFTAREGSGNVPVRHVEDGYRLGSWVAAQRRGHRLGTLAAHRVALLEGILGWKWEEARGRRPTSVGAA